MAVTPPSSGSTITPVSITDMHESVRTDINAVDVTEALQRGALGPQHVTSLLAGQDASQVLAGVNITTVPPYPHETAASIIANWQDLGPSGYLLDNGGAGYVLPPCIFVMWAYLRMDAGPGFTGSGTIYGLNLAHSKDAADLTRALDSRFVSPSVGTLVAGATSWVHQDKMVTLWRAIDYSALGADWTLDWVRCRAMKADVGAGSPNISILHGTIGFIAFHPQ